MEFTFTLWKLNFEIDEVHEEIWWGVEKKILIKKYTFSLCRLARKTTGQLLCGANQQIQPKSILWGGPNVE